MIETSSKFAQFASLISRCYMHHAPKNALENAISRRKKLKNFLGPFPSHLTWFRIDHIRPV